MEENEIIKNKPSIEKEEMIVAEQEATENSDNISITDNETTIENPPKKKKGKIIVFIVFGVLLIAAAVVSVILFFGKGKTGNKEKEYAQTAIEALAQDMSEMDAETLFVKVYVKTNDEPTDYTTEELDTTSKFEQYCYYNIISRVYIEFFGQQEINGKTSVTPMECCVFIDADGKTGIMYLLSDDSIKSSYRAQVQNTDYPELILSLIVKDYHAMYDCYFPDDTELLEWTEIGVRSGQKDLSIKEVLE